MSRHLLWQWDAPSGPAPDSYNLYKGMAAGAEVLYQPGLTGQSFADPEATPGSTYFGYVTFVYNSSSGGAESGPSNEATISIPLGDFGGPEGSSMSETHLFSTGILSATLPASFTASRGLNGSVTTPGTGSVSALSDTSAASVCSASSNAAGSNANYEYFILDLGVPRALSSVTLLNVTLAGATHSVLVTASNTLATNGVPAGTTIPTTPAGPLAGTTVTATPAAPVTARYLYIQDTNTGARAGTLLTLGEVLVRQAITLGVLQDVSFGTNYSRHDLFDCAQNSVFAVDTADHEGKWVIKAGNAAISAVALQMLIASALTTAADVRSASGLASLNTVSGRIAFPPLSVLLTLQDSNRNPVTVAASYAKAVGDTLALKLTDFAMQNFELHCYPDKTTGVVALLTYF